MKYKQVRKKSLGRHRSRWENINKMNLKEVRCRDNYCIDQAQIRDSCQALVNAVMNLQVP